jgi:hypothetical protein
MDKSFLEKCDQILDILNTAKFDNINMAKQIKNSKIVIDFCSHLDRLKKPAAPKSVVKKSKVKKNGRNKSGK